MDDKKVEFIFYGKDYYNRVYLFFRLKILYLITIIYTKYKLNINSVVCSPRQNKMRVHVSMFGVKTVIKIVDVDGHTKFLFIKI